jgi:Tol biopolymer transport system component/DNA-binding winged helix-turn-helix (wHTH) protein
MALSPEPSPIKRFGVFSTDLSARRLYKHGIEIRLQEQPFQVLALLLDRPGTVVGREELRQRLWPTDTFVAFDEGLNAAVNRLRRALGDSAENPRFIETLPRQGYRFIAPLIEPKLETKEPDAEKEKLNVPADQLNERVRQPERRPGNRVRGFVAIGVGALIVVSALVLGWRGLTHSNRSPGLQLAQFDVELRSLGSLGSEVGTDVILSPDGTRLVFVSRSADGVSHLNTRRLDQSQVTQLPGTEGARSAFFSPDGGWVGFWASGELKKVPVEGGSPIILCDANDLLGGSWGDDGNIIAAVGGGKLWRISSGGGTPAVLLDLGNEHANAVWPQVLPSRNVIFTNVGVTGPGGAAIEALSLSTGKRTVLSRGGTFGRYLPNGYLTYVNQGTLFALPFDLGQMQAYGTPTPVLSHVSYSSTFGFAQLDFSRTGAFVYRKDNEEQVTIELQDGVGRTEPFLAKAGHYLWPRLSPDGKRVAYSATESGPPALWIYDRQADRSTRVSVSPGLHPPMWTRDGRFLIFGSLDGGLSWIRADGTGSAQPLLQSNDIQVPWSFSPDGSRLALHKLSPTTGFDLWTVPIHSSEAGITAGKPEPFLETAAYETYPSFSPDGKWIAYGSNESGSWEVYARAFPAGDKKVQVSTGGGRISFWSRNGRELFYRTDDQRIMVANFMTRDGSFVVQKLRQWPQSRLADTGVLANLDLAPDGQRMVVLVPATSPDDRQAGNHVTFMLNFFDEVQRRVRPVAQ